jgi:isoleucyl-tRNA synthetase
MPADLYLEGSDQHRGWFHSALLTSVALHDRAPYRAVLTHGFTIDDKGRKMSKSLGNVILPQKVIGTLGADVLRLWIAATDYANEMSLSDEILKRIAESYRRIRNTVRFLLGNMAGFDPAKDQVSAADMVAIDRWALWRSPPRHPSGSGSAPGRRTRVHRNSRRRRAREGCLSRSRALSFISAAPVRAKG